ncbi:MAG: acyltransferase [Spirochaetes bacterium]|nr:acyltransferase [Spirochaetota bacterium]MBN2770863.1 acyltransferase [Spirochaetota bacterium]
MKKVLGLFLGISTFCLFIINTLFWCLPLTVFAFFKFIIPVNTIREFITLIVNGIAISWSSVNNFFIKLLLPTKWITTGLPENFKGWDIDKNYLVIANHCSAVDIVALQLVFNNKIPFFRFFLKKELIWVPFLGLAWWALDYPFMKRYSREFLVKNPKMKGKDLEITRKACSKYQNRPVSIMNFPEGTRFTAAKHAKQNSSYKYLLNPKAGGIGYVLSAMGDNIHKILNVTLVYPGGIPGFSSFFSGQIDKVIINIEEISVTKNLIGDYLNDDKFRTDFQQKINRLWHDKDKKIGNLLVLHS